MNARMLAVAGMLCGVWACTPRPTTARVGVGDFFTVAVPRGWTMEKGAYRNATSLVRQSRSGPAGEGRALITVEKRRSHDEALRRLVEIAGELGGPPRWLPIGGWAAVQRDATMDTPVRGDEGESVLAVPSQTWVATTAVAVGDLVVRVEGWTALGAEPAVKRELTQLGKDLVFRTRGDSSRAAKELQLLARGGPRLPPPPPPPPVELVPGDEELPKPALAPGGDPQVPGVAAQVQSGQGELEVAASADGQTVFVAANSGTSRSTDGGLTYTALGIFSAGFPRDGDPSLAVGESGTFYQSFIGYPTAAQPAGTAVGCTNSIATSPGTTFTYASNPVVCANVTAGSSTCFPDQEHIAADRVNPGSGGDQVYNVWRNFPGTPSGGLCRNIGGGVPVPSIVCSQDGASTWTAPATIGTGDFARVATGADGAVWVVYRSGSSILLNKLSSCAAGLVQQVGFPVTVSAFTSLPCPVAGLDRCNSGNLLSSPTVAVDDLDPNHIYVAYATSSAAGTDDVMVHDSLDGGVTWPRSVRINTNVAGRRFMPWMCTLGGAAHVGWYDRRNAGAGAVDLTSFYRGSAQVAAGALVAGAEVDLTGVDDPQCASGWPCAPRATGDSESCSTQPQLAGRCRAAGGGGSGTACDFSAPSCPAGETCQTGGGCPKYGDYNGIACAGGRIFSAWASATPPAGVTGTGTGLRLWADVGLMPEEVYVRDYTLSATIFDRGAEPSTQTVIWETGDVWNRQADAPGPLSATTAPASELARRSANPAVVNYAFVRVSRRVGASPTAPALPVTARFFYADYGAGLNFVAAGPTAAPVITLAAADLTKVNATGYPWHLPETTSEHVCLAVELDAAGDAPIPPALTTSGAGGATDARMREDNNKAQRNLETELVTGAGSGGELVYFAQLHNPGLAPAELRLVAQVAPQVRKRLGRARVAVVGGEAADLGDRTELVIPKVDPADRRFIALFVENPKGKLGELFPVTFTLFVGKRAVGGFTVALQVAPRGAVILRALRSHQGELRRLASAFQIPAAAKEAAVMQELLARLEPKGPDLDPREYVGFVAAHRAQLVALVEPLIAKGKDLPVLARLRDVAQRFDAASSAGELEALLAAHAAFLSSLDAAQTYLQRAVGDRADIVQVLRWQARLLRDAKSAAAKAIGDRAAQWLLAYDRGKVTLDDYPRLIAPLLADYARLAGEADPSGEASRAVEGLRRALPDVVATQGAHRALLLRLAALR